MIDEHGVINVHDIYDDCVDATMTVEDLNRLTFGNDSYGIDGRRLSDSSTLAAVQAEQIVNDPVQLTRTGQLDTSVYTAAISTEPLPVIPIILKDQIINITTAINLDALSDEDFARHVSKLTKINVNQLQVVDENSAPSHAKHLFFRRKLRRAIRTVKVSIKPVIKKVVTNEVISAVGKKYPKLVLEATKLVLNERENRKNGRRRGRSRGRILEEDEEPNFSEITTGNHSPRNDFFFHSEDSPCFTALELKQRHAMIGNRPPNLVQLSKELPDKQIVVLSNSDIVCSTDTIFFDTIPTDTWRIPTPAPLDA